MDAYLQSKWLSEIVYNESDHQIHKSANCAIKRLRESREPGRAFMQALEALIQRDEMSPSKTDWNIIMRERIKLARTMFSQVEKFTLQEARDALVAFAALCANESSDDMMEAMPVFDKLCSKCGDITFDDNLALCCCCASKCCGKNYLLIERLLDRGASLYARGQLPQKCIISSSSLCSGILKVLSRRTFCFQGELAGWVVYNSNVTKDLILHNLVDVNSMDPIMVAMLMGTNTEAAHTVHLMCAGCSPFKKYEAVFGSDC